MKTIEEKARAYDEVLKQIKECTPDENGFITIYPQDFFPELKEPEDEKIRKELIRSFKSLNTIEIWNGIKRSDILAWLEKQSNNDTLDDEAYRKAYYDGYNSCNRDWIHSQEEQKASCTTIVETGDGGINALVTRELPTNGEQNPTDKVEPKFKVGDFIVNDYCMGRVVEITNDAYLLDTEQGIPFSCHSTRLWDVTKDAKDGDVLANDTIVLIVDHLGTFENRPIIYSWYFANSNKFYGLGPSEPDRWEVEGFYPATKEQREQLKKTMADAGYTFDFERKELKKIEQKPADKIEPKFKVKYAGGEYNVLEIKEIAGVTYYGIEDEPNHIDYILPDNCEVIGGFGIKENGLSHPTKPAMFSEQKTQRMVSAEAKEAMYDKPTEWSEGDEVFVHGLIRGLAAKRDIHGHTTFSSDCIDITETIDWLKSLKGRVGCEANCTTTKEWSEEDKNFMHDTLRNLTELKDRYGEGYGNVGRCIDWLKSLRPQNTWKPSDEQMIALWCNCSNGSVLTSLYNDLKKLKEI